MNKTEILITSSEDKQAVTSEIDRARHFDYELTQKAARGDIAAFEQIYWRHHRLVYSLCLKLTRNSAEAEDITQNVFIKLFRKIGSFRGEANFSTWLYRFTYNEVLMHFRKIEAQKEQPSDEDKLPEQIVPGTENPMAMPVLDVIALKQAIANLPEGYRKVLILFDVEGYKHEEIAVILGQSVGTSKSQLHKARKKLCQLLDYGKTLRSEIKSV